MPMRRRVRTTLSLIAATPLLVVIPSIQAVAEDAGTATTSSSAAACTITSRTNFCDDFSSGQASRWSTNGGTWSVVDGRYVGTANGSYSPCGHPTNQSLVRNFRARNLDVRLALTSLVGVNKFVVLRSTDSDNQIELNFRAERPGAFPADLIVQEKVASAFILHTPEFSVLTPPHQVGQTIRARIRLTGDRLQVWTDGVQVLDRTFPFSARTGRAGVGVYLDKAAFDDVQFRAI